MNCIPLRKHWVSINYIVKVIFIMWYGLIPLGSAEMYFEYKSKNEVIFSIYKEQNCYTLLVHKFRFMFSYKRKRHSSPDLEANSDEKYTHRHRETNEDLGKVH